MKPSEIRQLIRMKPVELDATRRRLSSCHDIDDLRAMGRRLIPRPVFDYVDGGADEEVSLRANPRAFRRWRFQPRALPEVMTVDTSARLLDRDLPLPLALAPTGYTRMMHPAGEIGAARAALRHGLPYGLSTMGTTTIEAVAEAVFSPPASPDRPPGFSPPASPDRPPGFSPPASPDRPPGFSRSASPDRPPGFSRSASPDLWFQLYIQRDAGMNKDLVDRAAAAGYRVLMVTVDTIVTGARTRDRRNGLVIPPELTIQTLASIASRPGYWIRMLRHDAIDFANFTGQSGFTIHGTGDLFNPAASWDDIAMLRDRWPGKLVLKGPLSPSDARRAVSLGVDGLQLSNHGGRQLDRAVAPIDLVEPVREAVGPDVALVVDSGVRHGSDIAVALALGADACSIGRAYLYGLMAGGEPGVDRALDILAEQFRRTLHLLGVRSAAELRETGRELLVTS
jgi:L-lactate dehydrogenase (cytochrome)